MGVEWSYSYSFGEPFGSESDIWEICPAVRKIDDEEVTVFIHDKEKHNNSAIDLAIKYFRTLRHPGLLKCHEVFEQSSEVAVVTEAVVPLPEVIGDLDIHEVIAGIHDLIVTISFLHDKCKLSHNNLSLESIFIGQNDACWKIAGFENMCSFSDLAKEKSMKESIAHAKDVLGLGKLICDILEQVESVSDDSVITNFQQRIQEEVLEASLEKRPEVKSFLNDEIFQNGYCQILEFLRNITVKTSAGKAVFFRTLHKRLHELPSHVIGNRLLHLLLSRFVLIDPIAVEVFLPHLLTPQSSMSENSVNKAQSMHIFPLLPQDLYRKCCVPILKKLFEVNDRHVRLILLKYFHLYVDMFDKTVLKSDILPELRLGLQDSDDELVSATFSALQYLVPLVGADVVIGGERIQQFTERRPKFDTNALSSSGSEARSTKPGPPHLMTSKVKPSEGKSLQDKIQERERRREETRRRNEERRKQREKTHMEKKLAMKATVVEHVQEESGDEFDSWDNFESQEKEDRGEISDDSEHGRPSSSEVSIDSGFSERPRHVTEQRVASPRAPGNHRENTAEEANINKFPKGKSGFGMKLGKSKENTNVEKGGKNILLKNGRDLVVQPSESKRETILSVKKSDFKTNTSPSEASSSIGTEYNDILHSNEDNFKTSTTKTDVSLLSLSQTAKNNKKEKNITDKGHRKTSGSKERSTTDKNKKISQQKLVDTPWDDFDIKVTKKGHGVDIFADMAPTLSETRKAPVKGTSMYSDKLAMITDTQDADGWLDDGW